MFFTYELMYICLLTLSSKCSLRVSIKWCGGQRSKVNKENESNKVALKHTAYTVWLGLLMPLLVRRTMCLALLTARLVVELFTCCGVISHFRESIGLIIALH